MFGFSGSDLRMSLLCGCVVALWLGASQAADRFLSVISDLPLMPALVETPGSAVVFAKPAGRIVAVSATGAIDKEAVLAYYSRALPQLGWRAGAGESWEREGERLRFGFRKSADRLIVQFSLAPR